MRVNGGGRDQIRDCCRAALQPRQLRAFFLWHKPLFLFGAGTFRLLLQGCADNAFIVNTVDGPQHIIRTLWEPDMLRGMLIDQFIKELQNKIVHILRFQNRNPASVQIAPRYFRLFVKTGGDGAWRIVCRFHTWLIRKGQEKAVGDGLSLYKLGDILHTLQNHFTAAFVLLTVQTILHQLQIAVQIEFLSQDVDLQLIGSHLQIGGEIGDCVALFRF